MRTLTILFLSIFILTIQSCKKDDGTLQGDQSPIGEVGNTFTVGYIQGVSNASAYISDLQGGVSTITVMADVTDQSYISIAEALATLYPDEVQVSGSAVTLKIKARITDEGIAAVYNDGAELTYCEYDAGVGSSWSATTEGKQVTSTITEKTGVDDYPFGFWYIKVSEANVESDDMAALGMQDFKLYFNHKFGLVGINADFGSIGAANFNIYSDAEN